MYNKYNNTHIIEVTCLYFVNDDSEGEQLTVKSDPLGITFDLDIIHLNTDNNLELIPSFENTVENISEKIFDEFESTGIDLTHDISGTDDTDQIKFDEFDEDDFSSKQKCLNFLQQVLDIAITEYNKEGNVHV